MPKKKQCTISLNYTFILTVSNLSKETTVYKSLFCAFLISVETLMVSHVVLESGVQHLLSVREGGEGANSE